MFDDSLKQPSKVVYTAEGKLRDYAEPSVKVISETFYASNTSERFFKPRNPSDYPYLVKRN
jgi:hypothetical protein